MLLICNHGNVKFYFILFSLKSDIDVQKIMMKF